MMKPLVPVIPKIVAILPRLASEHDGEVVASVRAIGRVLHANKFDWHDFAAAFERGGAVAEEPRAARPQRQSRQTPNWRSTPYWQREPLLVMLSDQNWLSEWERSFVCSLQAQYPRALSPKQTVVIDRLLARAFADGGDHD